MRIAVDGPKDLAKLIRTYAREYPDEVGHAVYLALERTRTKAVDQTPFLTGNLRDSLHVTEPEITPGRIKVIIGAGGPGAPYAAAVHERTDVYHKPPTKAKYLEDPLKEDLPEYPRVIVEITEKLLRQAGEAARGV